MSLEQENEPEAIDNLNTDWIDEYEERKNNTQISMKNQYQQ